MCGRMTQYTPIDTFRRVFPFRSRVSELSARYNVAPGSPVLAVIAYPDGERVGGMMRWGLSGPRSGLLINARSETVAERPRFRPLLAKRRAVIPANGYYEWHQVSRDPYYFRPTDDVWLFLALYDLERTTGEAAFVILTASAPEPWQTLHPRVPLGVSARQAAEWLSADRSPAEWQTWLTRVASFQTPADVYRVSRQVNQARIDHPDLVVPVESAGSV